MTRINESIMHRAAFALVHSNRLLGGDVYLPKIFLVNGHTYWFRNAANRESVCSGAPIEELSYVDAYRYIYGNNIPEHIMNGINYRFNQDGELFDGKLFNPYCK